MMMRCMIAVAVVATTTTAHFPSQWTEFPAGTGGQSTQKAYTTTFDGLEMTSVYCDDVCRKALFDKDEGREKCAGAYASKKCDDAYAYCDAAGYTWQCGWDDKKKCVVFSDYDEDYDQLFATPEPRCIIEGKEEYDGGAQCIWAKTREGWPEYRDLHKNSACDSAESEAEFQQNAAYDKARAVHCAGYDQATLIEKWAMNNKMTDLGFKDCGAASLFSTFPAIALPSVALAFMLV